MATTESVNLIKKPGRKSRNIGSKEKTGKEARQLAGLNPFEELEQLFERFVPRGWLHQSPWEWPMLPELGSFGGNRMPRIDIVDRDRELVVRAELPGVDRDDLEVTMADNHLTLKAKTVHERCEEQGEYQRCEISRGSFVRTVLLPPGLDADAAKASFTDGLLELVIPKNGTAAKKKIAVE